MNVSSRQKLTIAGPSTNACNQSEAVIAAPVVIGR